VALGGPRIYFSAGFHSYANALSGYEMCPGGQKPQLMKRVECFFKGHVFGLKFNDGGFDVCTRCKYQPIKPKAHIVRSYLTELDRDMIRAGTTSGNLRLLQHAWLQLIKTLKKALYV
jgi:hypothetical protein